MSGMLILTSYLGGLMVDRALTKREQQILALLADGLTNRAIAGMLGTGRGTVRNQLTAIYERLAVNGRAAAAVWWVTNGGKVGMVANDSGREEAEAKGNDNKE